MFQSVSLFFCEYGIGPKPLVVAHAHNNLNGAENVFSTVAQFLVSPPFPQNRYCRRSQSTRVSMSKMFSFVFFSSPRNENDWSVKNRWFNVYLLSTCVFFPLVQISIDSNSISIEIDFRWPILYAVYRSTDDSSDGKQIFTFSPITWSHRTSIVYGCLRVSLCVCVRRQFYLAFNFLGFFSRVVHCMLLI